MTTTEPTYTIIRFYQEATALHGERVILHRGVTLEEAQAHCTDPSTSGEGWFDGYEVE